jgi:hypothetical protein
VIVALYYRCETKDARIAAYADYKKFCSRAFCCDGAGFEALSQLKEVLENCFVVLFPTTKCHSPVAQLAEQPTVNRQVTGSSPVGGAKLG